jgi:hypothetical protein
VIGADSFYSPRADFKHKNACTSTHLSGGLSRGEHVVIAPDVEQVSGGSAGGGRLAELVGAHRGVAADGGHGSRGEGCVPRAGVERMHTSRRRAGFGRGEGRGTSMARTYAPATAAACALRAAARPRKASCVAEPAPGSQPPIHATPAAGLCCGCTAAPAACVCALVQRGAPGRLPVAPSAPRRPEAAPRQAASRGVHSQLRRMGSAPGAARGVPAAEATTAVQATARSIAMGGVKTRNASTQKCRYHGMTRLPCRPWPRGARAAGASGAAREPSSRAPNLPRAPPASACAQSAMQRAARRDRGLRPERAVTVGRGAP